MKVKLKLPQREFITPEDVASALSIDTGTVRRWLKAEDSPPHAKVGGRHIIHKEGLIDWLNSRAKGLEFEDSKEEIQ